METTITMKLSDNPTWSHHRFVRVIEDMTEGHAKGYLITGDFISITISHDYILNWDNMDADLDHSETYEE